MTLKFVDFSVNDTVQFLIIDNGVFYKWKSYSENSPFIHEWLSMQDKYKFEVGSHVDSLTEEEVTFVTVEYDNKYMLLDLIDEIK